MKFSVDQLLLSEGVTITQRATAGRSTIEALEGILLKTLENEIELRGYDMETGIECKIPAEIEKPGEIVLNAATFSEIVRKLPGDTAVIETDEAFTATITGGFSEFQIKGLSGEDYPLFPEMRKKETVAISQRDLKDAIKKTLFAVSQNENKPVHTGSLFEIGNGKLNVVSVDGYRLALVTKELSFDGNVSFVVPGKTLNEVLKILKDEDGDVLLHISDNHILFESGNFTVIAQLLNGEFLNYQSAIPKEHSLISRVSTKELTSSVDRVSLLISEKNKSPIKLKFAGNNLNISCVSAMGQAKEDMGIKMDGKETQIGFNHRYLLDALKACEEEEVLLKTNGAVSPCVISPVEGSKFLYLVLPVRLRSDD